MIIILSELCLSWYLYYLICTLHYLKEPCYSYFVAEYPQVPPGLFIKHPTMSKDDVQRLISCIPENIKTLTGIFQFIKAQVSDCEETLTTTAKKPSSPSSTHSKRKVIYIFVYFVDLVARAKQALRFIGLFDLFIA